MAFVQNKYNALSEEGDPMDKDLNQTYVYSIKTQLSRRIFKGISLSIILSTVLSSIILYLLNNSH